MGFYYNFKIKVACMAGIEFHSALNNTATLTNSSKSASVNKAAKANSLCQDSKQHLTEKRQTVANNCGGLKQTHPLTLCLVVMMAFIVIMPHNVDAAAVRRHLSASATSSHQQTSAKIEKLLLLSEAIEELAEDYINEDSSLEMSASESSSSAASESESAPALSSSSDSNSYDDLSPLEVAKHMERLAEHQKDLKSKLQKRQINHLYNLKYFDGSSHHLVWHNPCNVHQEVQNVDGIPSSSSSSRTYYYLKKFKEDIRKEFSFRQLSLKNIKINDMKSWQLHRDDYAFLPKVKQNSSITLSRWYSNMQIYVASFAYLGRTQYQWDLAKRQYVSETTEELDQLLNSARLILCELETTINGSHPNKNVKMLKSFSRDAMDDKLQFQTKEQQKTATALVEPTTLDLKFAKNSYLKYLAGMRRVLKRKLKSKGHAVKSESSENTSVETDANNAGDDSQSSLDISSMMRPDSNLSLGESFELNVKSTATQKSQEKKQRRHRKNFASRKSAELPAF